MRRRVVVAILLLSLVGGGAAYWLFSASQQVPEFYSAALVMTPEAADRGGDEFSAGALALAGEARKEGSWSAVFHQDQINGWLAVDLLEKHPELLPAECTEPRIRLLEDRAQVGVRMSTGGVATIVWLDVEVRMTNDHEAALRFRDVRAGNVPLPPGRILDAVSQVADELDVTLRWTTLDGAPTAIIGLPPLGKNGLRYELTKLKLSPGSLFVAGKTFRDD